MKKLKSGAVLACAMLCFSWSEASAQSGFKALDDALANRDAPALRSISDQLWKAASDCDKKGCPSEVLVYLFTSSWAAAELSTSSQAAFQEYAGRAVQTCRIMAQVDPQDLDVSVAGKSCRQLNQNVPHP
jgi:hypothetical protein